jgi:hypothetical protein
MSRLGKLRGLSATERRTLAAALVLLPLVAGWLRVAGLKRCLSALAGTATAAGSAGRTMTGSSRADSQQRARATARLVRAAAAHGLYRVSCLPQSLVLWWLLRRAGLEAELRIGTCKDGEGFQAHAWVEVAGCALDGDGEVGAHFTAFDGAIVPRGAHRG